MTDSTKRKLADFDPSVSQGKLTAELRKELQSILDSGLDILNVNRHISADLDNFWKSFHASK